MRLGQSTTRGCCHSAGSIAEALRPPMQIVIGLVLLTTCVLLFANALRLVPNDDEASLRLRMLLAEMASSRVASSVTTGDYTGAFGFLEEVVRRHDYVLSAGLRRTNGTIVVQTAGHERYWAGAPLNVNTPTHVQILLYDNRSPWVSWRSRSSRFKSPRLGPRGGPFPAYGWRSSSLEVATCYSGSSFPGCRRCWIHRPRFPAHATHDGHPRGGNGDSG